MRSARLGLALAFMALLATTGCKLVDNNPGAKDPAFWRVPPSWAAPHDSNSLVYAPDAPPPPPKARPLVRASSNSLRR